MNKLALHPNQLWYFQIYHIIFINLTTNREYSRRSKHFRSPVKRGEYMTYLTWHTYRKEQIKFVNICLEAFKSARFVEVASSQPTCHMSMHCVLLIIFIWTQKVLKLWHQYADFVVDVTGEIALKGDQIWRKFSENQSEIK